MGILENRETINKQIEEISQNNIFKSVLESIEQMFCIIDVQDYTIKIANSAFYRYSYPYKGETCYAFNHNLDKPCNVPICPVKVIKETGNPVNIAHIHKIDGKERCIDIYAYPLINAEGKITHVMKHYRDITEYNSVEEKHKRIIDNPICCVSLTQDGKIIYTNSTFCKTFGYEKDELLNKDFSELISPDDLNLFQEYKHRNIEEKKEPECYILSALKKDGSRIYIEIANSAPFSYMGKSTILTILRNITEKRKMEKDLIRSQKLESIGILAGGIAHDFNNILTAIIGNISLAQSYKDIDKINERLSAAEAASLRATDLTHKLLTFSRGGSPIKQFMPISGILKDSTMLALKEYNTRCEFLIPDDIWPVEVDREQISLTINNLVTNAAQSMSGKGKIIIKAENFIFGNNHMQLNKGKYVRIAFKDEGEGISEENIQKIFDPYFTTRDQQSGLGLTTAYSIAKKHGGNIEVESKTGAGSIFYLYLPAHSEVFISEPEDVSQPDTEKYIPSQQKRILIMDDEHIIREFVMQSLEHFGYVTTTVEDGNQAIDEYKRAINSGEKFDMVILDLTVPGGMGGKETIEKIKEFDPDVNAIVSSGYSNDPIISNYEKFGFKGFIRKPYKIQDLAKVVYEFTNVN
ncbi:PAS domain S-box protein [Candidatus Poribacteria bacterium]|nr:PAS domain S-box protein [Candidatus Poribacteria bacterium]